MTAGAAVAAAQGGEDALVSVAIPAYNAAHTIAQTLDSLLAQTHRNLDIVVVDDGSTDDTPGVLAAYADRVRVIRQENSGIAAARNAGVRAARGDFIALLDADDVCRPDRIAIELRYLQTHPDILLCCSDFGAFDDTGPLQPDAYCSVYYSRCSPRHGGVRARYPRQQRFALLPHETVRHGGLTEIAVYCGDVHGELRHGNFIHPPTVMFRREALRRAGPFDPAIRIVCEWEWFVRVARAGPIAHLDLPLLDYRRSATQISAQPHAALDALAVAKKIYAGEAPRCSAAAAAARRHLGTLSLGAADMLAQAERWAALRLLAESVLVHRTVKARTLRTLIKIATPATVLRSMRRRRG
jgi:GT2 family glycosyltransferase